MRFIFACYGHLVCYEVDFSGVQHLHRALEARRHTEVYRNAFVLRQALHQVVVVAHGLLTVDEI